MLINLFLINTAVSVTINLGFPTEKAKKSAEIPRQRP